MSIYTRLVDNDHLPEHTKQIPLLSPLSGKIRTLDALSHKAFTERLFGEGVAIDVTGYQLLSPFDGQITQLPVTANKVRIKANNGLEIFIQMGLESDAMLGEGFKNRVIPGETVTKGQVILEFDSLRMKRKMPNMLCPFTILNSDKLKGVVVKQRPVIAGQDVAMTILL